MPDLFDPYAMAPDQVYTNIRDLAKYAPYKAHAEMLWKNFEPHADADFLGEVQRAFHQRFWEMYLGNVLLSLGHEIGSSQKNHGPDLYVSRKDGKIWMEAVAANRGNGVDAPADPYERMVEVMPGFRIDADVIDGDDASIGDEELMITSSGVRCRIAVRGFNEEPILLRYHTAIDAKFKKHGKYLEDKRVMASDPYVIALNGAGIPLDMMKDETPRIVKALFGLGDDQFSVDVSTLEVTEATFSIRRDITKKSGYSVAMDIFNDDSHEGVSAILYSTVNVANYPKQIGADFVLVHNPYAKNPLPCGYFKVGTEYFVSEADLKIVKHADVGAEEPSQLGQS
ncbi:MAG: hypothetical protein M0T74_14765 [Desulfitobacterium hafniense]|nr:hypothetical protein [Desulfitobacterium hafniense]